MSLVLWDFTSAKATFGMNRKIYYTVLKIGIFSES